MCAFRWYLPARHFRSRSTANVSMRVSAPIRVLPLTAKIPFPESGVGHEATRVHRAYCTCGDGIAVRSARAAARSNAQPRVLMGNHSKDPVGQALATALVQGLGALDWHGGDNLRIEWRWAGGDPALFNAMQPSWWRSVPTRSFLIPAQRFWRYAGGRKNQCYLRRSPIQSVFVANLAHPGGNLTGFSDFDAPMAGNG
jgi:hypothetical protein